jgi:hypothetical protein
MLSRSPRSRYLTIAGTIAAIIAVFIVLQSVITIRSMASQHGSRKTYLVVSQDVSAGESLNDVVRSHKMFSGDAPENALNEGNLHSDSFASVDLSAGTIITSHMVSASAADSLGDNDRIVFIPTSDQLSRDVGATADLIAVTTDGFGSDTVAESASILYNLSPVADEDEENRGYFVRVTSDEALSIADALSKGDIRFALVPHND